MTRLYSVQFTREELALIDEYVRRRSVSISRDFYREDLEDSIKTKLVDAIEATTRKYELTPEMISDGDFV